MISRRIRSIDVSGIRKAFDLAGKLENPCNLSIGQPHFEVAEPIKKAICDAVWQGKNAYTQTQGCEELRAAFYEYYRSKGAPQEGLMITPGVGGGLLLAMLALCDVGDEILIPDPYFPFYKETAEVLGVRVKFIDTYPDFRWTQERLEAAYSPKLKAIFVSSPANPTGIALTEEEIELITAFALAHDLWVVYDEIYERFNFDRPHLNFCNYYSKTLTLNGLSKSHSMTGWRLGVACGPIEVIEAMIKFQQYSLVCAPTPAQWAAITALQVAMDDRIAEYRNKRDHIVDSLKESYEFVAPDGAFYLFIKAPNGISGSDFVLKAIEHELILVPGSVFSRQDTHFRLSYANTDEMLERGIEILHKMSRSVVSSPAYG